MKVNLDSWSSSISTILKRTESNLYRGRHSTSDFYQKKDLLSQEPKSIISDSQPSLNSVFPQEEVPVLSLQEFLQFKSQISEKIFMQDQELEKLKRKQSLRERPESEIPSLREDFNFALNAIEKKCLNESKKLAANVFKNCEKAWKQANEDLKLDFSEKLTQADNEIKEFKYSLKDLKTTWHSENQEKLESHMRDFVRIEKVNEVKIGLSKDLEQTKLIFRDDIEELKQDLASYKESILKTVKKDLERLDKKLRQLNSEISETVEDKLRLLPVLDKELESLKSLNSNLHSEFEVAKKDKRLIKKCQDSIEKVKKVIDKLPDFTEFCTKLDLNEQSLQYESSLKHELSQLHSTFTNSPLLKSIQERTDEFSNKLEAFQESSTLKKDFEKFKKQILRKLKEQARSSSGPTKNSDKINDSLITKLIQIEQRVCVLEDFYETDSFPGMSEEKLGKEKIFYTSTELNSREVPSLLLSKMTPMKDECGSGDFEGMFIGENSSPTRVVKSPRYLRCFNERHSMEAKFV